MMNSRSSVARGARKLLRVRTVRRFARQEDGATAVEFGFVAMPFFALMFAIIESALVFLAGQTLESAAADSARLVLTGQAQSQALTAEQFRDKACERIFALFNCKAELQVDVRTYATFKDAADENAKNMIDANGKLIKNFGFAPGAASQVVSVRLIYAFPVLASKLLGFTLADMSEGKRLVVATVAFRNEPFGTGN